MIAPSLFRFTIRSVPSAPTVFVSDQGEVFRRDPKCPFVLLQRKLYCGLNGYLVVTVKRLGRKAPEYVHRLVGEGFWGAPQSGQIIRHLDGNPSNNKPQNLRWGTYTENNHDMVGHGTKAIGQKIYGVILNEDKVRAIRGLRGVGHRVVDIAQAFGISRQTVGDVCRFKSWRYLQDAEVQGNQGRQSGARVLREK